MTKTLNGRTYQVVETTPTFVQLSYEIDGQTLTCRATMRRNGRFVLVGYRQNDQLGWL